jgi:hypothetical protein
MAKALADYRKELDEIKAAVKGFEEPMLKNNQFMGQSPGLIENGEKELGLRIQSLKAKGKQGTALADFLSDPEVKKLSESIEKHLVGLEAQAKKISELRLGPIAMAVKRFRALEKEVKDDVASRKKSVSTLLGTGNKSLPDLEKLATEIGTFGNEPSFDAINQFSAAVDHRKASQERIKALIAGTKADVEEELEQEKDQQALNVRVLHGAATKAKTLYTKIGDEIKKGKAAMTAKKTTDLANAKVAMNKAYVELTTLAAPYERAQKDMGLMSDVAASKDKVKIEGEIKLIIGYKTKAQAEMKPVLAAK